MIARQKVAICGKEISINQWHTEFLLILVNNLLNYKKIKNKKNKKTLDNICVVK